MRNFLLGLVDNCALNSGLVVCLCLLTESPATGVGYSKGTFHSVNPICIK